MSPKVYENQNSSTKERIKYTLWTNPMDKCLSKILADNAKEGYKGENIIKSATYVAAVEALNEEFGLELKKEHVKNRLKTLKKQHAVLREILAQKGFKWDKMRKTVIANDSTWKEYIKVNPDAKSLQSRVFENYDEMGIILGSDQALAICSHNDTEESVEIMSEDLENAINFEFQSDEKPNKNLRWTAEMDTCLAEVLVEQVRKGYKLGHALHTEAYEAAVKALDKVFELGLSKYNIKNRLKTWRKQYSIVNELLSRGGFKWDAKQRMIVEDDSLWNSFIEKNPDAKSLRGRCIENYDAMCIIFGSDTVTRSLSTSVANEDTNQASPEEEHPGTGKADANGEMTSDGTEGSSQQTGGARPSSSHSKQPSKKRCSSDGMVEMMRAMAANIGRIADAFPQNNQPVCLSELFEMVKNIPGFDDDIIIDACEFLAFDEKRAKMFLKLDERLRKLWLVKRLRGNCG